MAEKTVTVYVCDKCSRVITEARGGLVATRTAALVGGNDKNGASLPKIPLLPDFVPHEATSIVICRTCLAPLMGLASAAQPLSMPASDPWDERTPNRLVTSPRKPVDVFTDIAQATAPDVDYYDDSGFLKPKDDQSWRGRPFVCGTAHVVKGNDAWSR